MRSRLALLTLLLVTLSACDSNDPDSAIGGLYVSTETMDGATARFTLDMPATTSGAFTLGSRSNISATAEGATLTFDVTGTGRYDHPAIEATITIRYGDENDTERLTGTVSDSRDTITMQTSDGGSITFTRQ